MTRVGAPLALAAALVVGCALSGAAGTHAVGAASAGSTGIAAVPTSRLVGQTLMGRMTGTHLTPALVKRIERGELGGVILSRQNYTSAGGVKALTRRLQAAAARGRNPPLLIATDQEGGTVNHLPGGPPFQSARAMGATGSARTVAGAGIATGRYLRQLGVNVDLAPVLDTPDSARSFLGERAFGSDPQTVAILGAAFAGGLQESHVAATAKHFPGLGTADANTDTGVVVIRTGRAELERRLAPFSFAIDVGVRLVMVSNAGYAALDRSGRPAVLSAPIVTGLLRQRLGFGGVVISDALGTPAPARYPDAPLMALRAGVDVLLYSDSEPASEAAYRTLLADAQAGRLPRRLLARSYTRIVSLKTWLGAAHAAPS